MNSLIQDSQKKTIDPGRYKLTWSDSGIDSDWDSFLASHDSGHHVQSSLWSEVKAINGWKTRRLTVSEGNRIIGGAQLLFRNVRYVGRVGYVPKGPILSNDHNHLADELVERIREFALSDNLRVLFVQPPEYGVVVDQLAEKGFRPCPVETAPSATVLVNLSDNLDVVLSRMPKGMRNGIRRSQKRGISVREATREELHTFHQLLSATSHRRGFSPFELDYFRGMWDILSKSEGIKLFLGELQGEAVSAQICIPFGDTVVAKQIGWSGKHSRLHPNEALDWFSIQWAKENGYKYYDLEGIERPAAAAILNGQPLPKEFAESPTSYKLRFGGEVKLYPPCYCFIANSFLRSLFNRGGFKVANWSMFQKAVSRFRTA